MARAQLLLAEVLGTFVLVFVGSWSIVSAGRMSSPAQIAVAFGFGLALLAGLYAFGEVSGGHFNPAVSLGMFLSRRLDPRDLIAYWVAQIVGAVLASLAVLAASNQDTVASTATKVGAGSSAWDAFWLEFLLTAVFVAVILQSTRSDRVRGTALIAIPITLVAIHLAAIPISGSSVNPARSLGPAIVGNTWGDIWIYLIAPPLGAIVGAILHGLLFPRYDAGAVEVAEISEV